MKSDDLPVGARAVARALRERQTFLLSTHLGPDGDASGSLLALQRLLRALGKECEAVHVEGIPPLNQFLPNSATVKAAPPRAAYDAAIVVDCGDRKRVALPAGALESCALVIDIDHHSPERAFGHLNWVEPHASASAELIYDLARELDVPIDADTATCLYVGIAADTGGFRYTNTTPRVLRICAELVERGAHPESLMKQLFHQRSLPMLKLLGAALANAVSECTGKLIWTKLTREDYTSAGATDADTEGLIDLLRSAHGCEVAALFRPTERGRSKGSLRCEPPHTVDAIAAEFGGGGHPYAAGFSTDLPLDVATARALARLRELVNGR